MTQAELIDRLGGGTKVAEQISALVGEPIDRARVYQWKQSNHVPWRWRPYVRRLAHEAGVEIPEELKDPAVAAA